VNPSRFLRSLLADLVEKKLWPVAIVLVVALVAIPLTLGRSSDEAIPPIPTAFGGPAQNDADVKAYDGVDGGKTLDGDVRDPFKSPGSDKPEVVSGGTSPVGDTKGGGDAGSGVSAGPTGGAGFDVPSGSVPGLDDVGVVPVGGSGGTTTKVKADAKATYSVDLRFGQDGKLAARTDVPRLSPLPSADDPFFVFLGVLADGKTATFLVSSDAEATGDAKCLPSVESCQRIEMRAGDTEFFDVVTPEGETRQYQLDLVRVQREQKATAAVAAAARAREDAAGRQVLRTAVKTDQVDVSDLAYSQDLGLVVPSGVGQEKTGSLFGGYRVDLRFGAPDRMVKRYNLARLTPLPSVESPSFVYLGVLADGETAIFLNPSEAAASGDAVCDPSPEDCQRVTMKKGDSALFDVADVAGGTTQYQLDVDDIAELRAETPAAAAASRTRESEAGRVILRRLVNEVGSIVADLNFSPSKGEVIERTAPEQPNAEPTPPPTPGKEPEVQEAAPADPPAPAPGS
jgi:hypothetical protein